VDYDGTMPRRINKGKHGIDFLDAIDALEDPARLEDVEPEVVHGESGLR